MNKSTKHLTTKNKIILIGIGVAVFYWFLEAMMHIFVLHEGHFIEQILPPDPHELWMRSLVVCLFVAFGAYAQSIVGKVMKAKAALWETEERFRLLVEGVSDYAIFMLDPDGRVVTWNMGAKHIKGYQADEIIGRHFSRFYPPEDVEQGKPEHGLEVATTKGRFEEEGWRVRKDGSRFWASVLITALRDEAGHLHGFSKVTRDITERMKAQAALQAANQQLQASEQQLKAANQQLDASNQQLRASEQQLKAANQQLNATNQQLRASEQQLKAANEQLRASEQQLKAANQQLDASNQQLRASEQQLKAANQQLRASEEELRKLNHELGNRVKELNCLYGLSQLIEQPDISLGQIFQSLAELIPPAWEYPEITCARVLFEDGEFKTANFRRTNWVQSADIKVHGKKAGAMEVYYLQDRPELDEGPFLKEERDLIEDLAERLGETIERMRAEEELAEERNLLRTLIDNMPDSIYVKDTESRFVICNKEIMRRVGAKTTDEIIGKTDFDLHPQELAAQYYADEQELFRSGQPLLNREEQLINQATGETIWNLTTKVSWQDSHGKIVGIVGIGRDITDRKRAEEKIRKEKEFTLSLLKGLKEGFAVVDQEGKQILVNDELCKMTGYSEKESLNQKPPFKYWAEEGLKDINEAFEKTLRGVEGEYELIFKRKDGERFIALVSPRKTIDSDGNTIFFATIKDITKRKQAEEKLLDYQAQLKSLASELSLTEERERRRIATELHATIGQSLVISKIKLDALCASAPPGDLAKTLDEVCTSLDQTIQDTRSLTFDLSSPILYELGFETAVAEWLAEQIQEKHGIATEFEDDKQPKPLDDDVRALLFRDVRELLINVVKHAQAQKVKVSIQKVGGEIQVGVEDDGWGFEPKKVAATAARKGGFGLFSIRERLEQLGGHLNIESAPGHGTKVTMIAPLKQEKINDGG